VGAAKEPQSLACSLTTNEQSQFLYFDVKTKRKLEDAPEKALEINIYVNQNPEEFVFCVYLDSHK
jgi:hypothetical protein